MAFDHRTERGAGSHAATTADTCRPGKRTLAEQIPYGPESDATVQMRVGAVAPAEDSAQVHAAAARGMATPATELPHGDRIQRLFGRHDVSGIQAHVGRDAAASARAMGAGAYAAGDHVVLGEGADLHTVAHEAAHVIQQRGGVQLAGGVGAAGDPYEQHADAVAARVTAGQSAEALLDQHAGPPTARGAVQRRIKKPDGGFFTEIAEVMSLLNMTTVSTSQREQLQRMMESKERDYTLAEVRDALHVSGGSSLSPTPPAAVSPTPLLSSPSPLPGSQSASPDPSTFVFLKDGQNGRSITFTVLPDHKRDFEAFRRAVAERLGKQKLAERLTFTVDGKPLDTCAPLVRDTSVWVGVRMGAPVVRSGNATGPMGQTGPGPDEELEQLVTQLGPDATMLGSHIDDTHASHRDSIPWGEKEVSIDGGMQRIVRALNVPEIHRQQALERIQQAIASRQKFMLVLIDPGFDESLPNHRHMVQLVEYLETVGGHQFSKQERICGKQKALVHTLIGGQVSIAYITAWVHGEKLPNVKSSGDDNL